MVARFSACTFGTKGDLVFGDDTSWLAGGRHEAYRRLSAPDSASTLNCRCDRDMLARLVGGVTPGNLFPVATSIRPAGGHLLAINRAFRHIERFDARSRHSDDDIFDRRST